MCCTQVKRRISASLLNPGGIETPMTMSNSKELAVSLGNTKYKLEEVQSTLNSCGLTRLVIKLITNNPHPEVRIKMDGNGGHESGRREGMKREGEGGREKEGGGGEREEERDG